MHETQKTVLISGSGRSPGGGNGNLLQSACLENPTDTGAWRAAVHGVAKSWTRLSTPTLEMGVSTPTLTGHLTIDLHNRFFSPTRQSLQDSPSMRNPFRLTRVRILSVYLSSSSWLGPREEMGRVGLQRWPMTRA